MRLLICAGGTGGGVYPALAVLEALKDRADPVLWVGHAGGMEADLVQRAGIPYTAIPAAGVHGVGWRKLPGNVWQLWRGFLASRRILREFQPDVMLFTGGFVAVPMALAGYRRPSLVFVPDIEPGLALKVLARFANRIALPVEKSRAFFGAHSNTTVTGYPTRVELGQLTKAEARHRIGLSVDQPVLLVVGGSKGARRINQAVMQILPELLKDAQVIHITGTLDWDEVAAYRSGLGAAQQARYLAYAYLHTGEMSAALSAADLVLSRAGASTLGEYPLLGLPAVLVPYPHAWRYQRVNAAYLAENGAALVLEDSQLSAQLLSKLRNLLLDPERLGQMSRAMHNIAQPNAAARIAELLVDLTEPKTGKKEFSG